MAEIGKKRRRQQNLQKLPLLLLMSKQVWVEDTTEQLMATRQFRKWLSIEPGPLIEELVRTGVVRRFVGFLRVGDNPPLQFEAAWALTNIASGTSEDTTVVIDHGAVPAFVVLLSSPSDYVREQAIWALGNIAANSPNCRDDILREGALNPLLSLMLNEHAEIYMLRIATWTLLNFCRGKPPPPLNAVGPAFPALARLINSNDDEEVLSNACWALSFLLGGTTDKIQAVIDSGICPRVVELLRHASLSVLIPALRIVGNIVAGNDEQTQVIINHQALPYLLTLLTGGYEKSIMKVACWIISNITAGNKEQIQAVINANIFDRLVHLLQNAEFEIKSEAAWAISNATSGGSNDQIAVLVDKKCILPLCNLLTCQDPEILRVCLEALDNILNAGEAEMSNYGGNFFALEINDTGAFFDLVNLGTGEAKEISEIRDRLLSTYWSEDGEMSHRVTSDSSPLNSLPRWTAKKRSSPSPSPFPLTQGLRLNGVKLYGVDFHRRKADKMVRMLNIYFEETLSCKRIKILEKPSWKSDDIVDVSVRYYKGTMLNDWEGPTTDVDYLDEPMERKVPIHLLTSGASNTNLAKIFSEMGAPADAYEDASQVLNHFCDLNFISRSIFVRSVSLFWMTK